MHSCLHQLPSTQGQGIKERPCKKRTNVLQSMKMRQIAIFENKIAQYYMHASHLNT